ncbi:MAG: nucleoside triphosphate pyrophosphohydrolase [bacterium]
MHSHSVRETACSRHPLPDTVAAAATAALPPRPPQPERRLLEPTRRHSELFAELYGIARRLRGDGGCPWDQEQTLESLTPYILEEAHEVSESLHEPSPDHLRKELGDLLFLVLMMIVISEETDRFTLEDVLAGSAEKMIRRHPHVFGDVEVDGSADVRRNWEAIKKGEESARESVLDGIPKSLSPLLRARRVQEKAASLGFDWTEVLDVVDKIDEETGEIRERLAASDTDGAAEELGDLLFSAVNLSRFLGANPEHTLARTTEKFRRRFRHVEAAIAGAAEPLTLAEMDAAWREAKVRDDASPGPAPREDPT